MSELAKALLAAQAEFPSIPRSRTVEVTTKTGRRYTFAYAPLDTIREAIQPALTKNGLAVSQLLSTFNAEGVPLPALQTILLHTSGERLESEVALPVSLTASPQEFGSVLTYLRRYAVVALLGIATEEDDDANLASGNSVKSAAGGAQTRGAAPPPPPAPSPAAETNPALEAQAAYEASRTVPEDDGDSANVVLEFGKHKGETLGSVPEGYLKWITENVEGTTPHKRRVLLAAQILTGADVAALSPSDDDIPFAPVPF